MPISAFFSTLILVVQLIFDFTLSGVSCNTYDNLFSYPKLSTFELLEFLIRLDFIEFTISPKLVEFFFTIFNGELVSRAS